MRYYTNSEMGTFKECRRKWWLGTYRQLRLKATRLTGAAPIGTRVHQALEGLYQPPGKEITRPGEMMRLINARNRAQLIEQSAHLMPANDDEVNAFAPLLKQFDSEAELTQIMVDGYEQWLAETGVDSDYIVLASEETVSFEFTPGYSIAGRRDTRVQRISDGIKLSMDHKTGDFAALRKQAGQNEQMLLYEILQRITDPENRNEGMVLNMIRKVKRTATAKPPFYDRHEIKFNQHQLESAWYHVMAVINDIQSITARLDAGESHQTAVYPRPSNDCSWKCEFYPVCPMFDDGSRAEDMIESYYVVGDHLERYPDLNQGTDE